MPRIITSCAVECRNIAHQDASLRIELVSTRRVSLRTPSGELLLFDPAQMISLRAVLDRMINTRVNDHINDDHDLR